MIDGAVIVVIVFQEGIQLREDLSHLVVGYVRLLDELANGSENTALYVEVVDEQVVEGVSQFPEPQFVYVG